jgi:hypothetical protein
MQRWIDGKLVVTALVVFVLAAACSSSDGDDAGRSDAPTTPTTVPAREPMVQAATLEGPISAGEISPPFDPRSTDLAELGYVESEWFASGTATRYAQDGERSADGRWHITPDGTAPYKTRMVVRMPANPDDFSGVVAVEWLNVSATELAPDWAYLSDDAIADSGVAWIGVSAQALAIEGGQPLLDTGDTGQAAQNQGLKTTNPTRYASLEHPGDAYSFDIYSQIAAALRTSSGRSVLNGAPVERVLAIGESQSAGFLTAYLNGVEPVARAFDGYFVHSRFATGARFDGAPGIRDATPDTTTGERIRTDLDVPVFVFETEGDVLLGYGLARQPDTERIRVWEVAGTGHSDTYLAGDFPGVCPAPINDGPQHWVVKAAFTHLVDWVTDGTPPPRAERLESDGTTIHRDDRGIALGGIRTPDVDVPVATLSGEGASGGPVFCQILGSTTPFDDATLRSLYPTHQAYVEEFDAALDEAIDAGYVRESDRAEYAARARAVTIPE